MQNQLCLSCYVLTVPVSFPSHTTCNPDVSHSSLYNSVSHLSFIYLYSLLTNTIFVALFWAEIDHLLLVLPNQWLLLVVGMNIYILDTQNKNVRLEGCSMSIIIIIK